MTSSSIYKITCKLNGMIYVGQTTRSIEKRFKEHARCQKTHIGRAIRKYGKENFTIEILEECEMQEQLNEREKFWIAHFDCIAPKGYNLTDGGESNFSMTPETCAKISAAKMGEKHPLYGKSLSQETRAKLSAANSGEKNPRYGKTCSLETRAKISAANSGENNPNYGKQRTGETRAKMSAASPKKRAVVCLETGEHFETVTAAALRYNTKPSNVSRSCQKNQATVGYHFRYAEEVIASLEEFEIPKLQKRRVMCIETGEQFDSLTTAARHYNIKHPSNISCACRNPKWKSGGYHWRYLDEQQSQK